MKTLILFKNCYSLLVRNFLSLDEQIIDKNVDEVYAIICDDLHRRTQLFLINFRLFDAFVINAKSNLLRLSS